MPRKSRLKLQVSCLFSILLLGVFPVVKAGSSQSLPVSCGDVGAQSSQASYTKHPLYPVVTEHGAVITVSTTSDNMSGDVSSVAALIANPGPDGLSLREAITATNNDPGVYTIDFAPSLKGETIDVGSSGMGDLPALTGGNVIINGEIGGDTKPGVTIGWSSQSYGPGPGSAFMIASSGNTLYGLSIRGFSYGVQSPGSQSVPSGTSIADTTISNDQMNVTSQGVSFAGNGAGHSVTWSNTLIQNNTILAYGNQPIGGMRFFPADANDTLDRTSILDNTISLLPSNNNTYPTAGINFYLGGGQDEAVDTLIADNTIQTGGYSDFNSSTIGINVELGGNYSNMEGVTVEGNSITMGAAGGGAGIGVSDGQENAPYTYHGSIRDAWILDNTIKGPGIQALVLGEPTGSDDSLQNIYVLGNELNMSSGPLTARYGSVDFFIFGATGPFGDSFRNNITNLYLGMNTLILTNPSPQAQDILLVAGAFSPEAYDNLVTGVYIFNNYLEGGGGLALQIVGGLAGNGPTGGPENASSNVMSHVEVWCNLIPTLPSESTQQGQGAISIIGGQGTTTNNTVEDVLLIDNLVAETLNSFQATNNVGLGASGNFVNNIVTSPLNVTTTATTTLTSISTVTTSTVRTMQAAEIPFQAVPIITLVSLGALTLVVRLRARFRNAR